MKICRIAALFCLGAVLGAPKLAAISFSTLNKNDPYPYPNTLYPYDFVHKSYAFMAESASDKESQKICRCCCRRGRFTLSAYTQYANKGTSWNCESDSPPCPATDATTPTVPCDNGAELGDLLGRWNVLGLFYPYAQEADLLPATKFSPGDVYTNLQLGLGAQQFYDLTLSEATDSKTPHYLIVNAVAIPTLNTEDFPGASPANFKGTFNFIINPANSDPGAIVSSVSTGPQFGFISVPIKYTKMGIRGHFFLDLFCNCGIMIQGGFCSINQRPSFNDLTCDSDDRKCGTETTALNFKVYKTIVRKYLTDPQPFFKIAQTFNIDLSGGQSVGLEDTVVSVIMCGSKECNKDRSVEALPHLIFSPFVALQALIPTGLERCIRAPFSLPTGSNGHWGVGGTAGMTFDFVDSVDFGFDLGVHYFEGKKFYNVPVPTHALQSGLYPYSADIKQQPGTNLTLGMSANVYHLVDTLSLYAAYRGVFHGKDSFEVLKTYAPNITSAQALLEPNMTGTLTPATIPITIPAPPARAVLTGLMRNQSTWRSNQLIAGLTYDITRCMHLGLGAQIPLSRCNAYRTSTIFGSFGVVF